MSVSKEEISRTIIELEKSFNERWSAGGGAALSQVWVFLVAPLAGCLLAAVTHRFLFPSPTTAAADSATRATTR
ncbi:hypothetical protein ACFVWG_13020 [Kribbella sp. NPDC058245]|uniref:hypothetical protein n=1 Tax=Kribbella sp. NPDC058245 TaxID=3346399 RepID=UPI0036E075FE